MTSLSLASPAPGPTLSGMQPSASSNSSYSGHPLATPSAATPTPSLGHPLPTLLDRTSSITMPSGYHCRWARPGDEDAIATIYFGAFTDCQIRMHCFPETGPESSARHWWKSEAHHWLMHEQLYYVHVVEDASTGEVIAFCKWSYHPNGYKISEQPQHDGPSLPEVNSHLAEHFFSQMGVERERIHSTTPHIILSMLGVDGKHQGKRLAGLLLSWGITQADKLGLPIYLESTTMGYPVYQKRGFQKIGSIMFDQTSQTDPADDVRNFEHWSKQNLVVMIRPSNCVKAGNQ
ncbi:hypothetical protein CFIMG_007349RA00001 [Ceratocystis fimbriata CBS 114723]|uniref:N-acetyltransferase domain-containing protein n=1 Tax=Ceratocystis fimbriata CBS 114723 TaxID=1035309 RepID=A0A2C5WF58_9PEZI|nr:hypothetical protein CFIMG_007349RA00001 [Ceratocystis fimbriata CBS 114723]